MNWALLLLTTAVAGGIIYWLLVLSEGVYLGNRVVVALYEQSASRYDAIKGVMVHEDGIHLARPLVDALQRAHPSHAGDGESTPLVLDVATGTGRLPQALLRQLNFNGRIVGLDPSRRMLAVAQSKTGPHRHRVAWIQEDAMALPFRESTFHAVTCVEALEFLPNPEQALAEMVRVLRPGGQLLLSNRVGIDAIFLPGRAFRPGALEKKLKTLGLTQVKTRRWQTHYDLIDALSPSGNKEAKNDESDP